jgi:hypothetical protein
MITRRHLLAWAFAGAFGRAVAAGQGKPATVTLIIDGMT